MDQEEGEEEEGAMEAWSGNEKKHGQKGAARSKRGQKGGVKLEAEKTEEEQGR